MTATVLSDDPDALALIAWRDRGDSSALGGLFERHAELALRLANHRLGNLSDAEDAVQDAFIAAMRGARSFRSEAGSVRGWLMAIVLNTCANLRRGAARRQQREDIAESSRLENDPDIADAIDRALAAIPEQQRQPIELRYLVGLEYADIAAALGRKEKTVRGQVDRGLENLRTQCQRYGLTASIAALIAGLELPKSAVAHESVVRCASIAVSGKVAMAVGAGILKVAIAGALVLAGVGIVALRSPKDPPAPPPAHGKTDVSAAKIIELKDSEWWGDSTSLIIDRGLPADKALLATPWESFTRVPMESSIDSTAITRRERALQLLPGRFSFGVIFIGKQDGTYHSVTMQNIGEAKSQSPAHPLPFIDEPTARSIVLHLYRDGFFRTAEEFKPGGELPPRFGTRYYQLVLKIGDDLALCETPAWDANLVRRLDALTDVIGNQGANDAMGALCGKLFELRMQKETPIQSRTQVLSHLIVPDDERYLLMAAGPRLLANEKIVGQTISHDDPLTVVVNYSRDEAIAMPEDSFIRRPILLMPVEVGNGPHEFFAHWQRVSGEGKAIGDPLIVRELADGAPIETSPAVVRDGVSYATALQKQWILEKGTLAKRLLFGLRLKNERDQPVTIAVMDRIWPHLIGSDGGEPRIDGGRNRTRGIGPITIKAGETQTVWYDAAIERKSGLPEARFSYYDRTGGFYDFDGLTDGTWRLRLSYSGDTDQQEILTEPLAFTIE